MPKISFVSPGGTAQIVEAPVGQSVMEAATNNLIDGIVGECGGSCSCATCHVYIDESWYARLPPPDEMETAMLEGAIDPGPLSRLSCQIKITPDLDGLIARVPANQA